MTLRHVALPLYNLGCAGGGATTIERILRPVPGVMRSYVNPVTEMAYVEYDRERCDERQLTLELERAGYGGAVAQHSMDERRACHPTISTPE